MKCLNYFRPVTVQQASGHKSAANLNGYLWVGDGKVTDKDLRTKRCTLHKLNRFSGGPGTGTGFLSLLYVYGPLKEQLFVYLL